uniref:Cytochrome P450 CYP6FU1 n=1 Tax=Nilaparvata lugens TaxID=108931 RepID=A0A0K0LBB0_NILLU|nr:cytochrome P450 CYP6FU1 [Nilaparvata lugens]
MCKEQWLFDSVLWLLPVITLITGIITLFYFLGTKNYNYWTKHGVFSNTPRWPFLGNLRISDLPKSNRDLIKGIYDSFEGRGCGGFYFLTKPVLVVRDPDLIVSILVSDFTHFSSRGFHSNEQHDPLSKNLIHLDGPPWKQVRPKMTAAFGINKLRTMISDMDNFAAKTLEQMSKHSNINAEDLSDKFMIDVVSSCLFGINSEAIENPESAFYEVAKQIFDGYHFLVHVFVGYMFPAVHTLARMTVARSQVTHFFKKVTNENLHLRKSEGFSQRKDFFQTLVSMKETQEICKEDNGGSKVCDEDFIAANLFMFFSAGFDSSGKIGAFIIYELAANKEMQTTLRDEVLRVLEKYDDKMSFEALQEMTYLEKIVAEANRKYPILMVIFRKCEKAYRLPDGGLIEPGINVMIPSSAIHYDPKFYPDPEKFDPERFSEENKSQRHQGSYLPFGIGPRICPAWQFAILELKVFVARIVSKYELDLHPSTATPMRLHPRNFLLSPESDIIVNLTKV